MNSEIKTYTSEDFRKEYFNASPALERLFRKSLEDFFCLRIEDVSEGVLKPIQPSREESHTLIFVTEGSYKTKLGFKEYTVSANQIVVLQAGVVFSTEEISTKVKGFTCHFHPDILIGKFGNRSLVTDYSFLNIGAHPIIDIREPSLQAVKNIYERLSAEFKSDGTPRPTFVHAYLYALLTELNALAGESIQSDQDAASLITTHFKKLAHQYVRKNLKVSDFSDMMNISPNHLNKAVKKSTQKSASEVYNEIKLIEIKFLLYQSNLPISHIAYEMGYLDPSYFTRFFRKASDLSPSAFREMIEKS